MKTKQTNKHVRKRKNKNAKLNRGRWRFKYIQDYNGKRRVEKTKKRVSVGKIIINFKILKSKRKWKK